VVEAEAVNDVGLQATANAVARFEDKRAVARPFEFDGGSEAGCAGANDDDLGCGQRGVVQLGTKMGLFE
jgi:hypothetical protein